MEVRGCRFATMTRQGLLRWIVRGAMSSLRCTRTLAACIAVLVLTGAVFAAGYFYDNKYAVSCPRGADAEFAFTSDELDRPLVLIDGWLMDLEGVGVRETFIGQYSNFSYVPGSPSAGPWAGRVYTRVAGRRYAAAGGAHAVRARSVRRLRAACGRRGDCFARKRRFRGHRGGRYGVAGV